MRKRAYPEYKSSGIKWLGKIPAHWRITPVKYVGRFYTGWTPPTGRDEFFLGDHLWANISDLGPKILQDTAKRISDEAIKTSRLKLSPQGSLLFSFKLSIGQVSIAGVDMYTNEAIATFPPGNGTDVAYLYWAAPLFIPHNADENIYGAKLLNQDLIKNARMAIPPEDEQRAIAGFLDRETARIDALVEKKERQIELLREKRAAVISHAVTGKMMNDECGVMGMRNDECGMMKKGATHHSSLRTLHFKPSGVEWLGEIPEHWEVRRLKHVASMTFSNVDKNTVDGEEPVRLCNYVDVYYHDYITPDLNFMGATATPAEIARFMLKKGDVIVTKDSEAWDDIAVSAYVATELTGILCGYHLARVRGRSGRMDGEYLFRAFQARGINDQFRVAATGITRFALGKYWLDNALMLVPPVAEQRAIAAFLDRETARIDALIEKVRKSIDLLQEYRTSLVSAAVTGKIKVNDECGVMSDE